MIHNPQLLAIGLTSIGLDAGREYSYNGIDVYMLQAADGTDYIVQGNNTRAVFNNSWDAAQHFASLIWGK